jgi:uncharacterized protein YrzB (UPF0473 family)
MDEKMIYITNEDGETVEYEVILTYVHPETNIHYVIYKLPEEEEEVFAARYEEESDGEGSLTPIETEEEFDMIEEILEAFTNEEE